MTHGENIFGDRILSPILMLFRTSFGNEPEWIWKSTGAFTQRDFYLNFTKRNIHNEYFIVVEMSRENWFYMTTQVNWLFYSLPCFLIQILSLH